MASNIKLQDLDYKKTVSGTQHLENVSKAYDENLVYRLNEEPEFHLKTWFALAAMFLLNLVQVFGLLGPPAGLAYIEKDLNSSAVGIWVPNSLALVQAVFAPMVSSLSDTFQARKSILVGASTISFVGAAIAPSSSSIDRVIAAQILIGFGLATVPLAYCVPSEILPRKWRPMAQASMNIAAALGACSGPLIIGALTKKNLHTGWRNFYWIQMGLWGATAIGLFVGYKPPKRHTLLDHLSFWQKIGRIDLLGFFLLASGLALLLTGLNLGGSLYAWQTAPVLVTLLVGIVTLIAFGVYEWKFTKSGILHHDLFRGGKSGGQTFAICVGLIFIEGAMLFAYTIFFPILISTLFETDPFLQTVRQMPYWIACAIGTVMFGYWSTRYYTIRAPIVLGFLLFTGGMVGLATIQPSDSLNTWFFAALAGFGYGAPLILVISGVQLSTPHHLIATATAATTCSRAIAVAAFTAIFSAAMNAQLKRDVPSRITERALRAGLPQSSLALFIESIISSNDADLQRISGVTPAIIRAGYSAYKQGYADGLRVVYIIAAPFGAVACIASLFLGEMKDVMNYEVDAPVEQLQARQKHANVEI